MKKHDQQWIVTLIDADGNARPGEPFPASGHENFTKLQQVSMRLAKPDDLLLWSPVDEMFIGSKPSQPSGTVDNFVWGPGVGRGMVLLTVEALRL